MPYCSSCGKEVQAGARFCPSCGADVSPSEKKEEITIRGKRNGWKYAVLLFVLFVVYVAYSGNEKSPAPETTIRPATQSCGVGQVCAINSNTGGDRVFVFVSKDALDELVTAYTSSSDAARREVAALMVAGQVYMVPNGTSVNVLEWSGWSGWHRVRIVSADPHTGDVGYLLDQWTIFK